MSWLLTKGKIYHCTQCKKTFRLIIKAARHSQRLVILAYIGSWSIVVYLANLLIILTLKDITFTILDFAKRVTENIYFNLI
jgi:hypothetical protein